jgi:rhomboid-like protein
MTGFVLVTVLLCYCFAHYYLPPSPSYRMVPLLSPTAATIGALLVTNIAITMAWRWMPLWPILTRYFMHVPGYPRAIQALLNIFSHLQYEHLLTNVMMLCIVGPACHDLVGRGTFIGTYISAGAVGTLASLYWANVGRGKISAHSLGASAAIWGIAGLYCLLTDKEKVKIPFLKDREASIWPKTLFAAFVLMEIRLALKKNSRIDHASHFGGMAVGMGVAGYMRATGIHEKKLGIEAGVQERADVDDSLIKSSK